MNELIKILKNSGILKNKWITTFAIILFAILGILTAILIVCAIIPAQYLPEFLTFNFKNINVIIPLITSTLSILSFMFVLVITGESANQESKNLTECVKEIYKFLDEKGRESWKNKGFSVVKDIKESYEHYKDIFKYNEEIKIGISSEGNLYISLKNTTNLDAFLNANKGEGWIITEDNSTSIYRSAEGYMYDSTSEDIVKAMEGYMETLKEVFPKK